MDLQREKRREKRVAKSEVWHVVKRMGSYRI